MAATTSEILLKLKMISDVSDVTGNVKQIQQVLNKIDMPKDLKQKFTGVFADLERETKNYQNLLNSGFKGKKDVTGLEASGKRINALMKTLETSMKGIRAEDLERSFRVDPASIQKLNKELEEARTNLSNIISSSGFQDITKEAETAANAMQKISKTKFTGNFLEAVKKGDIQGAADALKQLEANHKQFKDEAKNTQYNEAFREMSRILGELQKNTALQETNTKIQNLKTQLGDINITELQKFLEIFQNGQGAVGDMTNQVRGFTQANNDAAVAQQRTNSELDQLKSRIGYFFSLTNSVQLFRRAVTSALNTVKELDKTMTEAAVVTEFDVGDMWNKLPQYAKEAQKLGVSINGMYQATTLYYQQGLKTNAAMQLGIETMKMAKIAGMDSTDATKAMTAALRGFNMELNEMSATKVNDVYSQLAAVTAADTNQIATAMEKTASIAASANMEFETTAALLAQIIETTQEAPETAGTAMKTIIARFSEVKSLKASGQSTGQDEEGEGIDVNKIQTALRSVGISMDNFFAGTEGLDSVLLKLAEKWDGLDFETQRYIATMAAGSRQQSRFIAMMSDYSRTTELVTEAQNSAGASQRQFNKTLESMESKLQRLSNAWDQFTMGLTNNEILKGAVDLLADMIEGVNKLTNGLSAGNGLIKSVVSLGVALGGLTMGRQVVNGLFGAKLAKTGVGKMFGFGESTNIQQKPQQFAAPGQGVGFKQSLGGASSFIKSKFSKRGAPSSFKKLGLKQGQRTDDFEKFKSFATKTENGLGDRMDEQAMGVRKLNEQLADGQVTTKEAAEGYEKLGYNLKKAGINTKQMINEQDQAVSSNQRFVQGTEQVATGVGKMANGMFIAGAACAGLSAIFQAAGWDEGAEAMSKISGIVMGLGAVFMVLPPIITGVGKVIATAGLTAGAAWIWILGIAALITVLIVGISHFSKANTGLAKNIEKTNSQIDQMTTATKEAEDALESITETRKELAEMQSTFAGLTKGTDEWRKALVDSNSKVLELLNTYPQLAEYIKPNEDGLMEVSTAGWEKLIKLQSDAIINTQSIAAGLQLKKANLELQQLGKNEKKMTSSEFFAKKTNAETQRDILAANFQTSAIASSKLLSSSDYADNAAAALGLEESTDEVVTAIETATKEVDTSKWNESELIKEYAALTGKEESDVKKQLESDELTKEDMAAVIGTQKVMQDSAKKMEDTARKISNIKDKDVQKTVTKLLSKDGKGLKQSDLDNLKNNGVDITNAEAIQKYLSENAEIELSDEASQELVEILKNVSNAYTTNFKDRLVNYGLDETKNASVFDFVNDTEYGVGKELVEKIGAISAEGGSSEQIEALIEMIQDSLFVLSEEDRTAALQMIADTNWESQESIAGMVEYLQGLDNADIEGLDNLGEEIKKLTDATSENTAAQLRDKGYSLSDLIKLITSGEINEDRLTDDQKEQIKNVTGATDEDFIPTGTNQWQYKGDLYTKVVNLYADNIEKQKGKVDEAEANYEKAKKYAESGFGTRVTDIQGKTNKTRQKTDEELREQYSYAVQPYEQYVTSGYTGDFSDYLLEQGIVTEQELQVDESVSPDEVRDETIQLYQDMAETLDIPAENPSTLTTEQMLAKIKEWDEQWRDTEVYKKEYQNAIVANAQSVQSNLTSTTAQLGWETFDNKKDQQTYNENRSEALENRLLSTGGSVFVDKLEKDVNDALKGTGKTADDFADAINGLASDIAVTATKTKTFAENMSKLSENLNKNKRGSVEYGQALGQAKTNVASFFGISLDELDAAGISDELYEQLAKGNPAALTQMQNQIASSVKAGTVPLSEAFANAKITPQMDQAAIEALYYQLGGAEGSFNTNMNESLKYIQSKLAIMGTQFAYQINEAGVASAVTTQMDYSSLYKSYTPKGSGGSSKWKNPFDKLYNNYEEINKLLREREQIERRYDKILNSRNASYKDIIKNAKEELSNLEKQRKEQEKIKAGKADEIQDLLKSKKGKKYDQYFDYDEKTGEINIAWSKVNKLKGSKGEGFEEFVSQLEGLRDQWQDAQDELDSISDSVDEIRERGKDEYFELEDQIKQALIDERQDEIDKLSEINDSINDTNSKLLDSMQQQIDEYRQNRDNQKTEDEIADKQRRLAYLQQDTSGANATEILNLQKEIDEAQEDYTDTLIDQKISELQKQNDQAAEQRQRQIEIMEAQLQHYEESGAVWKDVYKVMNDGANFDKNSALKPNGPLAKLLQNAADYTGMSELGKEQWMRDMAEQVASALGYVKGGNRAKDGEPVTFKTKDGKQLTGTADKEGNIKVDGHTYTGVHKNEQGNWVTDEKYSTASNKAANTKPQWDDKYKRPWKVSKTIGTKQGHTDASDDVKGLQWALAQEGLYNGKIDGSYGPKTKEAVSDFQEKNGGTRTGFAGPKTKEWLRKIYEYKTGGLADFTGPAWLDGTKSKPEYILNADQTKAFFNLVDVLGSLQSGNSKATQNNGDTSFDIDINVESISNDYDVEQLANKVKSLINEDARYRNNNAINLMR